MAKLQSRKSVLTAGFICGIVFGFLLQRGHATQYKVVMEQLLLTDFTIVKIMLSAIVVGMVGVHLMRDLKLVELRVKETAIGSNMIGGLVFGAGFALLGYCPGTVIGAVGQGSLDALLGGVPGILLGAVLFSALYPRLVWVLNWRNYGEITIPRLLKVNHWVVITPVAICLCVIMFLLEKYAP